MNVKKTFALPVLQAFLAALLFAASTPISKVLLKAVDPIPLAAFLYLGSGLGALLLLGLRRLNPATAKQEASLTRPDLPWLLGAALVGGVLAPIALLFGLQAAPASTSSLLLNFESAATALIAALFFRESIGKRITWALLAITLASVILTWTGGEWGFSVGALLVLVATVCWGLDNNLTNKVSLRDPLQIVAVKGVIAGSFSLILALLLRIPLPALREILLAAALGIVSYGFSIALIILSMRSLGSARAYALFGSAPFIGIILSVIIFRENPSLQLWLALPLMLLGSWLMLTEHHAHPHTHIAQIHNHTHKHPDPHHVHEHEAEQLLVHGSHSHAHTHDPLLHAHPHMPDLHHKHSHPKTEKTHD